MTEISSFWQGTGIGDAPAVEYSSQDFSDVFSKLLGSHASKTFVIPGYANNLNVVANGPAAMNVIIKSGAAFVRGRIYENTADAVLTVAAADATNPRLDRVILRASLDSSSGQTIVATILTGTPAATPALPSLTQTTTTYETTLFYIYVAATVTSITDGNIHDERDFAKNFEEEVFNDSLIANSEFLGNIDTGHTSPAPPGWTGTGSYTPGTVTKPSLQPRGQAITITAGGADGGIQQTFPVIASTTYTIQLLTHTNPGKVGKIVVTTNSGAPGTITRLIKRTSGSTFYIETIRYTTEADASTMTLKLLGEALNDVGVYGQPLAVKGFNAGPFRIQKNAQEILIYSLVGTGTSCNIIIPSGLPYKHIRILFWGMDNAATGFFFVTPNPGGAASDAVSMETHHSAVTTTTEGVNIAGGSERLAINFSSSTVPTSASQIEVIIYNYESAFEKEVTSWSTGKLADSSGNFSVGNGAGFWRSTSAITNIVLQGNGGFAAGLVCSAYLFN